MIIGIQNTVQSKPIFICLDVLNTEIQNTVQSKPIFICLDVLNTGIQNKPVFDPELHTEFIIKDECENITIGNL